MPDEATLAKQVSRLLNKKLKDLYNNIAQRKQPSTCKVKVK